MVNNLTFVHTQIIDCCNREVGKMRQMEELVEICNMLEFDKLKVSLDRTPSMCPSADKTSKDGFLSSLGIPHHL